MTTLTATPLAPLLDRLFAEAAAAPPPALALAGLSGEALERAMRSKTGYRDFYGRLKAHALPVARATGELLYLLARSRRARIIAEFGTSFGISTLYLAAALRDNGGGCVVSTEFEPSKAARARANLAAAGLADLVEIREGDALETFAEGFPGAVDLLLLDGAKGLYREVLDRVEGQLAAGALVVADDAGHCPDYLAYVRSPANGYLSVAVGEDVEVSLRLG